MVYSLFEPFNAEVECHSAGAVKQSVLSTKLDEKAIMPSFLWHWRPALLENIIHEKPDRCASVETHLLVEETFQRVHVGVCRGADSRNVHFENRASGESQLPAEDQGLP